MANEKTELVAGSTGNRYSEDMKKEAVKYLEKEDTERGNMTRAMEKFGCSYIALRSWIRKFGSDAKASSKPAKKVTSKASTKEKDEEGPAKRGRKANPSIAFLRTLEKMKNSHEKSLAQINKAIEKVTVK